MLLFVVNVFQYPSSFFFSFSSLYHFSQFFSSLFFLGLQSSRLFLLVSTSPCSHSICDTPVLVNASCLNVSRLLCPLRPIFFVFFVRQLFVLHSYYIYVRLIPVSTNTSCGSSQPSLAHTYPLACCCHVGNPSRGCELAGDVTVRSWAHLCLARKCGDRL